jgi:hypothetical protein
MLKNESIINTRLELLELSLSWLVSWPTSGVYDITYDPGYFGISTYIKIAV